MDIETKQIKHFESLREDIRDEIKRRIEQRDKYSLQFVIALATIAALFSFSNTGGIGIDFRKVIVIAPGVSIYFSVLILYSYRIHYILTKYLSVKIEPKLATLHELSRDYEWENFYRSLSIPGIRKNFFLFTPWIVLNLMILYILKNYSHEFIPWLFIITFCVYLPVISYFTYEFWDDYTRVGKRNRDFPWPDRVNIKNNRAVFIDRDGTINKDTHFTYKTKDLEFLPGVIEFFKELSALPLEIIIVSNQAGIAFDYFKQNHMSKFNKKLREKIKKSKGRIDAFYFCPHFEPKHLPSEEPPCECSKPAPGMLLDAAKDFELDLEKSYLIGDKLTDTEAGNKVKCKTILISQDDSINNKINDENRPNHIVNNFIEAVKIVKSDF
jgi:D,D-heptose 1,7-bisphosphate phosphatase